MPSRATMCGTVAWLQDYTCGDDEQFDLAAWFPSLSKSWSRVGQLFYFLILWQCELSRVFHSRGRNEINSGHKFTTYLHLIVRMNDEL